MPTGAEIYDALTARLAKLDVNQPWPINTMDALDLKKLRPSDLVQRDCDEDMAKSLVEALSKGDIALLGHHLNHELTENPLAPMLLEEPPTREERIQQLLQGGLSTVSELIRSFFPANRPTAAVGHSIETILKFEYGDAN